MRLTLIRVFGRSIRGDGGKDDAALPRPGATITVRSSGGGGGGGGSGIQPVDADDDDRFDSAGSNSGAGMVGAAQLGRRGGRPFAVGGTWRRGRHAVGGRQSATAASAEVGTVAVVAPSDPGRSRPWLTSNSPGSETKTCSCCCAAAGARGEPEGSAQVTATRLDRCAMRLAITPPSAIAMSSAMLGWRFDISENRHRRCRRHTRRAGDHHVGRMRLAREERAFAHHRARRQHGQSHLLLAADAMHADARRFR